MARGVPLSVTERHLINRWLDNDVKNGVIARRLGRHRSVVDREIQRNGGRDEYYSYDAQRRADEQRRRPKTRKLVTHPALWTVVRSWLRQRWSPEQISLRLRKEYPADHTMRVSPETIYQTLFMQAKGTLRAEVAAALRRGRLHRRSHAQSRHRGQHLRGMTLISDRPAEANDRAVPGFWEGDLLIGKNQASQIATLVERTTRYVILVRIPYDRTADRVARLLADRMNHLPALLKNSITWDRGHEMARHAEFTIRTGMPVYFCDPHSPWQRGTNENTNGLLRQYLPKGTDLSGHTQAELDTIADQLNNRPRKTLDALKPTEALNRLLLNCEDALTP